MKSDRLHTKLCDLLNIRYPILQAGMGFVSRAELCAAVSQAGGLGVIGAAFFSPEELRQEIRKVKALTDNPFGVDILFATVGKPSQDAATASFTEEVEAQLQVVFEEGVAVLASGLGDPASAVPQAHELGMKVLALVGNVRSAKRVEAGGADIVIAQGYDAGGHTGTIGTQTLVPAIVDAVSIPVVAAGGIANGRGLVSALALGAVGVWMGTRFITSDEAYGHINYKRKITEIDEYGTTRTRCFTGKTCRVIRNSTTEAWEAQEMQGKIEPFPRQFGVMAEWLGEDAYVLGREMGEVDRGTLAAGQSSALISEILPAGKIVAEIAAEAIEVLDRLGSLGSARYSA